MYWNWVIQFSDITPLHPPLWTQSSPKKSQSSNDLATASKTLFSRRYVDDIYVIPSSLMNSDKAKTHNEHTGTVGIDEQETPQQDEQKGPVPGKTEATPMQCAHGPLVASPALSSFQGWGLSTSSHHVGSAYAPVLIWSGLLACNDPQPAHCSHSWNPRWHPTSSLHCWSWSWRRFSAKR